uniref:Uncharacterized protein n=1 Tax=Anguilla anguilla TaxID=7936 RepID=A0A0E9X6A7_ANGAN
MSPQINAIFLSLLQFEYRHLCSLCGSAFAFGISQSSGKTPPQRQDMVKGKNSWHLQTLHTGISAQAFTQ